MRIAIVVAIVLMVPISALSDDGIPEWRESGWCNYRYPPQEESPPRLNLPAWACQAVHASKLHLRYTPYTKLNPFFIIGDFNGDGKNDIAIWISNNKNRKVGILLLQQGRKEQLVVAAGTNVGDRGDDFNGLDAWSIIPKGDVLDSVYEGRKVKLRGDAIIVEKAESAAFAIYWNGNKYDFFQVSD